MSEVPPVRIIEVTNKWAMGEFCQCIGAVWRGQPTSEALKLRASELVDLAHKYPGACALLEVVEPTSKPPTDETRRVAMDVFRKLGNDLAGIGFVIEGNEVRSTLTRAIITGMLFFVKQPQPTKLFRRTTDMVGWVRQRMHVEDHDLEQKLIAGLEYLRGQISAV